ncbi:centrosomal protein of 135 kDa-like isoform X2 [Asparagus officinalis]|uniref:centrosomal protein of 135 kDa-like isoform X2 n=1 Tax=Asparagus officinalis TaxID=4686 RepID=UPI00098E552A|nr:centrosomal protein of 135 kDa-like isoform X2 [Asparagus officinalis]
MQVTIQRVQADVQKREADANGDAYAREQERKTSGQLDSNGEEEGRRAPEIDTNSIEEQMQSPCSRNNNMLTGSNRKLRNSLSTNSTASTSTDKSSEQHVAKENRSKYSSYKDYGGFQSPQKETRKSVNFVTDYRELHRSVACLSITSGPEGSSDGSTNSSADTGLGERLQESEDPRVSDVSLIGNGEVSKLELQTLRRQLVKETKRVQDLARELRSTKEESDAFRKDFEEIKGSQKRLMVQTVSSLSHFNGEGPWSILEETKQELTHEKRINANLRLQLEKTQESNSELILAVEDLEKVLEQKNREAICSNCRTETAKRTAASDVLSEFRNSDLHIYDCKQELLETTSEDSEQYALEELVKGHRDVKIPYSLDHQIIDLNSEIELYKRDREDLEIQMEQLALDYEILKQENHEITSKLEQYRLQEQLRMQYECCTHSTIISDLEVCIRNLQNELQEQAEAFKADLQNVAHAKIEQEKRAIRAEDALRKTRQNNASKAEQLQEEFERLSTQMSMTFQMNEKLATQALSEASELRLQKCQLEELLEETNKQLASVQYQSQMKVQDLLNLIAFKTNEADKLLLEFKVMSEELQNLKNCNEAREKALSEEKLMLKDEVERLSREKVLISEEFGKNKKWMVELEQLKASSKETEMALHTINLERDRLKKELFSIREVEEKAVKELDDLRQRKDEKETVIRTLSSDLATLRAQYNDLKNSLFEDEAEKENLRKQVFRLRDDLKKKEDAIINMEKKLKDSNSRLTSSQETTKTAMRNKNNVYNPTPQVSKEVTTLREKIKVLEGKIKLKDTTMEESRNSFVKKERDMLKRIEELQKSINEYKAGLCGSTAQGETNCCRRNRDVPEGKRSMSTNDKQLGIFQSQETKTADEKLNRESADGKILLHPIMEEKAGSHNSRGSNKELAISSVKTSLEETKEELMSTECDQGRLAEILTKMTFLKDKNEAMEAELKEMQERYTEMSLKFAEVEGERQQLVMTVRALKNSLRS